MDADADTDRKGQNQEEKSKTEDLFQKKTENLMIFFPQECNISQLKKNSDANTVF